MKERKSIKDKIKELRVELAAEGRSQVEDRLLDDEEEFNPILLKDELEDEMLLRQYLLGGEELTEEDKMRIEDRLIADEGYFAQMRLIEDELIEDYLQGVLSDEEVKKFKSHFMSTPERRQSIRFAEDLRASIIEGEEINAGHGQTGESQPGAPIDPISKLNEWGRSMLEFFGLSNSIGLVLMPGQVRGSTSETSSIELPPHDQPLQINLILEDNSYQSYRAELRTVEGQEVWREENLKAQRTSSGDAVVVTLPPGHVTANDYIVTLSGAADDGGYEKIGTYFFRVRG